MIRYTLSFEQYHQHLIDVTLECTAIQAQQFWLPTWVLGSYLIREFSRFIEKVQAFDAQGNPIAIEKINKNTWQLGQWQHLDQTTCYAQPITLKYQVYAYDLSVRGSYVDQSRFYINPATLCLAVKEQEYRPIELVINRPDAFKAFDCATTLPIQAIHEDQRLSAPPDDVFFAKNYQHFIDHPLEIAVQQQQCDFLAANIPHRIAISGHHHADLKRLSNDLQAICQTQINLFGAAPFNQYLFMVMATGNGYGGLEHQTCTSLITPRGDLPRLEEPIQPQKAYRQFLGLCSHEYFHAWLVKFIRPQGFDKPDLNQEIYTSLLWVFEGITSYYDDQILYRSGVIDEKAYLELLAEQITRYKQTPGRLLQSASESSFDAWIKFYRSDENTPNAGASYYNVGALLALCLDLTLQQKGSGLDALLQSLFVHAKQGHTVDKTLITNICQTLVGDNLDSFWQLYVEGTTELPLQERLATVGVELQLDDKTWAFGLRGIENSEGVHIKTVLRDGEAARAGLSANDVLVAIDHVKATAALINQYAAQKSLASVTVHAFRRDELMQFNVQPSKNTMPSATLRINDQALFSQWFNGKFLR